MTLLSVSNKDIVKLNELNTAVIIANDKVDRYVFDLIDTCCLVKVGDPIYDLKYLTLMGTVTEIKQIPNYDGPGSQRIDYDIAYRFENNVYHITASVKDDSVGNHQQYMETLNKRLIEARNSIRNM